MSKKKPDLPFVIRAMTGCGVPTSERQASAISKEDAAAILAAYKNKSGRGALLHALAKIQASAPAAVVRNAGTETEPTADDPS
ncbi:hypothetical protein [Planctomycetes bacterium TBK1r]|uniref:Uncharacterized protein n=1 Tax=Stieleria magnilauensis TaxID=2527963 RepID=A0ABX5XUN7_9BACT|nr:hypothetical protein TBK1r_39480 [Planctomycetes bacterium TBK1r]